MPDLDRRRLAVLAVVAVAVVVLGLRQIGARGEPPSAGAEPSGLPVVGAAPPSGGGGSVTVHVAGAVREPGVYRLRSGQRVDDAVQRAGGATAKADLSAVNLAAPLEDGRQILVPVRTEAGAAGAGSSAAPGAVPAKVNLNTATAEQLDTLAGVGPATAAKILAHREQHGAFGSVEELADVPGIGERRLAALRELVTV